jgi:hypothetical protein
MITTLDKLVWVALVFLFLLGLATSNDSAMIVGSLGLVCYSFHLRIMEAIEKIKKEPNQ